MKKWKIRALGGPGSGHWGHASQPGRRGGSLPRSTAMSIRTGKDWERRWEAARRGKKETPEQYRQRVYDEIKDRVDFTVQGAPGLSFSVNSTKDDLTGTGLSQPFIRDRVERVADFLGAHPTKARNMINKIHLYDEPTWNRELRFRKLSSKTIGFYSTTTRDIHMPRGIKESTFHHEVGHALIQFLPPKVTNIWYRAYAGNRNFDRRTSYARSGGVEEGFCETYSAFISAGGVSPVNPFEQQAFDVIGGMLDAL